MSTKEVIAINEAAVREAFEEYVQARRSDLANDQERYEIAYQSFRAGWLKAATRMKIGTRKETT